MATKAFGSNIDVEGWALTSQIPQQSGEVITTYQGNASTLQDAIAYVEDEKNEIYFDSLEPDIDEQTGVATIKLTKSANNTITKPTSTSQVRTPTVVIQGAMLSPQLHMHPTFKDMPLSGIASVNYCLSKRGQVTRGNLHGEPEITYIYARWRSYGIDTYLAPSYTMTITFYLKKASKIGDFILKPCKVWRFDTTLEEVPNDLRPTGINVPAWLAQAPNINSTRDGITVSQAFIGAEKFPNFYETEADNLVYEPPELIDKYWRDDAIENVSSGEE